MGCVFLNSNPYKDTDSIKKGIEHILHNNGWDVTTDALSANLAVSIGGDGTFLDTARAALQADILGINMGTLGYLTEVEKDCGHIAVQNYINGNYLIENRMMLECAFPNVDDKGTLKLCTASALNDIVISKRQSSVIDVEVSVDGRPLTKYYADGVIISTPTGSTGYAFSCGAPVVDPSSEMIMITPIAPHTLMNRSICLPSKSRVAVKLVSARNDNCCSISVDGNGSVLHTGDYMDIKKSNKYVRLVKFSNSMNFIERMASKLNSMGQ